MAEVSLEINDSPLYQFACSPEEGRLCDWTLRVAGVSWLFLAIGTLGNCFNLLVLSQGKLRAMPTTVYFAVLSCADLSSLWIVTFVGSTSTAGGEDIIQRSGPIACVMTVWGMHTSLGLSVWMLVLLTIERFLCIVYPHYTILRLTRCKAIVTSAVAFGLICLTNGHMLFGYTWHHANGTCVYSSEEYKDFKLTGHSTIVLIMACIVPVIIISAGNITIGCKLRGRTNKKMAETNSSATKMLLFVSCLFIVSSLPSAVFWITVYSFESESLERYKRPLQFVGAWIWLLMLSNVTFNFFLYCASGSLFREELKSMIRRLRVKCSPKATANSRKEGQVETVL